MTEERRPQSDSQRESAFTAACLLASAALVVFVAPPVKLEHFIGNAFWARLALGVIVFLVLYAILAALGLVAGKIGLPFGLTFERDRTEPSIGGLVSLGAELRGLKDSDERIFKDLEALTSVLGGLTAGLQVRMSDSNSSVDVTQYIVRELLISQQRGDGLARKAITDDLTGLANRRHFNDEVNAAIAAANGTSASFGLLLLDLDHFKDINDTLGHRRSDEFLADLGPRLATLIGEDGLVARLGGDEFAILLAAHTENMAALATIVEDVKACVREPIKFDDITLQADASIGMARYPHDGQDAETLLLRADVAMYNAKANRGGHRFYAHHEDPRPESRLAMVSDFRRALEHDDELIAYLDPIVDLLTGQVRGAEALVRWQHPKLGLLQPAAFLETVEQTGLIGAMTIRVLEKAIGECAAWNASGRDLTMSVNLSIRDLHDRMLLSNVTQILDRHHLPSSALQLEITESMILSDPSRALKNVEGLNEIGVRFAIDDFGTGHSSLANLRRMPVHELKIDRSFVTPMLNDESDGVIVRSTIELGHALGLKVSAQGVETRTTLRRLEDIGCDRAQGKLFSKPLSPIEFARWLSRYETGMGP